MMKRTFILLALCAAAVCAGAQEELSLTQCRELALKYNKEKQAAGKATEAARQTVRAYRANFFPDLSVAGGGLYGTADGSLGIAGGNLPVLAPSLATGTLAPNGSYAYFPGTSIDYKLGMIYMAGLQLKQPLYMGGKIRAGYRMARTGLDMALQNERLTDAQVMENTDKAYAQVVKAREMKRVAEKYNALLVELDRNVESAVRHGLKLKNDRMKVQVKLNESELQMRRADNALRLATMNLCRLIGRPLDSAVRVADTFPEAEPLGEMQTSDVSRRPEFALLEKKVELAGQQVRLSRSEMLPQVALLGTYNYTHGLELNNRSLFNGWDFAGGVTVSVPLFHFGERISKVKAAKAQQEQASLERESLNEQMVLELTQAANNVDEARLEAALAEKALVQAEENLALSGQQFKVGMETLSDHLEAQALWQAAYETSVDARYRLYLSHIAYRKAAGTLVE